MSDTIERAAHTEMIGHAVGFAESGKGHFLKTFGAVPADKQNFTPAEGAKTPIQLGAHIAVSNNGFAQMFEGGDGPMPEMDEMIAMMNKAEAEIDTAEKVVAAVEKSHTRLIASINGLSAERFASKIPTPFGEMVVAEMVFYPGTHYHCHASQVDYVQTCYGDFDFHI